MRTVLFIIIIFLAAIVDELEIMPNSVTAAGLLWASWALANDYYKSISKAKEKKGGVK